MKIDLIAQLKTAQEFMSAYKKGDEHKLYEGKSLIFYALSNINLATRYEISNFLLDKGVDVLGKNSESETVLHVLFGQAYNDVAETCVLFRKFIERGVDINARNRMGQVAIQLVSLMGGSDEELKPLYDLWFSLPNLDLVTKDKTGYSPIKYIENIPYRATLLKMMRDYENGKIG